MPQFGRLDGLEQMPQIGTIVGGKGSTSGGISFGAVDNNVTYTYNEQKGVRDKVKKERDLKEKSGVPGMMSLKSRIKRHCIRLSFSIK